MRLGEPGCAKTAKYQQFSEVDLRGGPPENRKVGGSTLPLATTEIPCRPMTSAPRQFLPNRGKCAPALAFQGIPVDNSPLLRA